MRLDVLLFSATLTIAFISSSQHCIAQSIGREFKADYSLTDLGQVKGLPPRQGGISALRSQPDTLLIGGHANTSKGMLYSVNVKRDASNSIVAMGKAQVYAKAPFNDGGLCYAPNGTLLFAQWPINSLGQIKTGSNDVDQSINLGPKSEKKSLASFGFHMPSGRFKLMTWSNGKWFDASLAERSDGTYELSKPRHIATLRGAPEGFVYVPDGSPMFPKPSLLIAEFNAGNIAAYEVTKSGDPIVSTRRVFISGLEGAEGGMIDSLTGDFLFTTFGSGDRIIRVDGLKIPLVKDYSTYYPPQKILKVPDLDSEN